MHIELRKFSHNSRLSEETYAYTAQVWVDGIHVCDVSNHGQGGCDMLYPAKGKTQGDVKALNEKIKATYPKNTFEANGETYSYDQDLEGVCHDLVSQRLIAKDLQRSLSRQVLFQKKDEPGIYQVSLKGVAPDQRQSLYDRIKAKHGCAATLNEMPFDAALAIYSSKA